MVPPPRKAKIEVARKRLAFVASAAAAALLAAVYFQRERIAVEFWAARLERLGDERSVIELAKLARGSAYALQALAGGLDHPTPETRARVACALSEFPRAREALVRACSDADELVSSQARFALGLLGEAP